MKKSMLIVAAIIAVAVVNYSAMTNPDNQARTIITKMINAVDSYKGLEYTMRSEERITGMKELRDGNIFTKLMVSPHKIYMRMVTDPNKGTEVLYVEGERGNKALVNPGKFLPTVTLVPTSGLLTKDQHHTLTSAGFGLVSKIIGAAVKRADEQKRFDEVFKYVGDVNWNNRNCYKLVIEDPTWAITTYKAVKGDNMQTVFNKLLVPEYSLTELDGIKSFDEDLGGKTLKVPTSYAKKTVFYIDKETNLPIFQEMSDDKGIFERYSFTGVKVNPAFKADEFTKGFSEYKF
jgi:outer membrane lipoprotein-sorting protein